MTFTRVVVGVDELVAWCQERQVPVDSAGRSQFTAYKLSLRHQARRPVPRNGVESKGKED